METWPHLSIAGPSLKPPREKRKKTQKLRRIRKNKKTDDQEANEANEATALVIHATYQNPTSSEARLEQAKKILFTSHSVAKFTELMWQFCLILFLTALTNYKSLVLVSTYGLFSGIVVCLSGPSAGALVDSKDHNRLHIAQFFIWVQNVSVIVATICCFFLLRLVPGGDTDAYGLKIESEMLPDLAPPATYTTWCLLIAVHIFGACGKLTDQSMTVAMERDWIVVMSKVAGRSDDEDYDEDYKPDSMSPSSIDSERSEISTLSVGNASLGPNTELNDEIIRKLKEKNWLSQTNTIMKQIDLICKVAAPAAAGIFFACFDNYKPGTDSVLYDSHWEKLSYAALIIGILNLISLIVEYNFMQQIYDLVPSLAVRGSTNVKSPIPRIIGKHDLEIPKEDEVYQSEDEKTEDSYHKHEFATPPEHRLSTIQSGVFKFPSAVDFTATENTHKICCLPSCISPRGFESYLNQPIFFGGFALSLLYLNVLTFGALMTAYLVWRGMDYESIGALRGISSIIGLMGTVAYHFSSRNHSLSFTGSWSIIFQFSCLSICYASLYISNDRMSLFMLIIGVIASRIGLYVFDLTITQLMQQLIPEDIRGVMGGVQKSMNGFFDLTTYGLGLLFPDPNDFHILVATGFTSVGVAMCVYLWGIHYYKDVIRDALK